MIFSTRSVSDSCILLILVVFVSIRLTYCNFRFFFFFEFHCDFLLVSSVSTSFRKSKSGSRIEEGWDALFFIAIFLN